jgi:hypothetical protein
MMVRRTAVPSSAGGVISSGSEVVVGAAVEVVAGTVVEVRGEAVVAVAGAVVAAVGPLAGEPAQAAVSRVAVSHQVSLRQPVGRCAEVTPPR